DRLDVLEHLPRLLADAARDDLPGGGIERDLPGHVDEIAVADALGVGETGAGALVGADDLALHVLLLVGEGSPGASPATAGAGCGSARVSGNGRASGWHGSTGWATAACGSARRARVLRRAADRGRRDPARRAEHRGEARVDILRGG